MTDPELDALLDSMFEAVVAGATATHSLQTPECPPVQTFVKAVRDGWPTALGNHAPTCPYCQHMIGLLYEEQCPNPREVRRYLVAPSAFPNRIAMRQHLSNCNRCSSVPEGRESFWARVSSVQTTKFATAFAGLFFIATIGLLFRHGTENDALIRRLQEKNDWLAEKANAPATPARVIEIFPVQNVEGSKGAGDPVPEVLLSRPDPQTTVIRIRLAGLGLDPRQPWEALIAAGQGRPIWGPTPCLMQGPLLIVEVPAASLADHWKERLILQVSTKGSSSGTDMVLRFN